jgi:hypothetical protein
MISGGYKMPYTIDRRNKAHAPSFHQLYRPIQRAMVGMLPLEARGHRPLKMTFEEQLKALIFFHLEEHVSGQHLLQVLEEDDFARDHIAPEKGIKKSSFAEAINSRGLEQLIHVYQNLQTNAVAVLPNEHDDLGDLIGIDGSLIDACLSMYWADYRKGSKKAKVHLGFDLNRGIPRKVFLFDGNGAERPFVRMILSPGQTGVMDRGYQNERKNVSGGNIMLNPVFDQFVKKSPISVMARGMMERVLDPQQLDKWFDMTTDQQYTRELLFSTVFDIMSQVVHGRHPSVPSIEESTPFTFSATSSRSAWFGLPRISPRRPPTE